MMRTLISILAVSVAFGAYAGRGCPGGGGHPPPPPHYHHDYHRSDFWGRGGENFWPGFVGGVVGGVVANAIVREPTVVTTAPAAQQTVVVQQPIVVQQPVAQQTVTQVQNVWVEGRYVDQVQANGTVVRTWSPGHYEQRTVTVR